MDDVQRLIHRRRLPEDLDAIGQQLLLNLVLSGPDGYVEIWIKAREDAEPINYVDVISERAVSINQAFDETIVKLGFPKGTGRLV